MHCRSHWPALIAIGCAALVTLGAVTPGRSAVHSEVGSLALDAALQMRGAPVTCPPEAPSANECYQVNGEGVVPGLGRVSESFVVRLENNAAGCPALSSYRAFGFPVRLAVVGKGAIDLAVAGSSECLAVADVLGLSRPFTVTGGTGVYATAAGSGTLVRHVVAALGAGTDTWRGTLVVPGLEFNLTAPTIRGAAPKTVRAPKGAKRARVRYAVTEDDVDGQTPVSCTPTSGSLFRLGRTKVTCFGDRLQRQHADGDLHGARAEIDSVRLSSSRGTVLRLA